MKKHVLSLIFCCCMLWSCNQDDPATEPTPADIEQFLAGADDVIPLDLLVAINDLPVVRPAAKDLILPNGLKYDNFGITLDDIRSETAKAGGDVRISPINAKNAIIKALWVEAIGLTERTRHTYPDEGTDRPAQQGLAYVPGGDIDSRRRYEAVIAGDKVYRPCSDFLYGLDAAGFIYRMFRNTRIPLAVGNTGDYAQGRMLQKALAEVFADYKLLVQDMGRIPVEQFEAGDFLYWTNEAGKVVHIGMLIGTKDGLCLANSSGEPGLCDMNKSADGGPAIRLLDDARYDLLQNKGSYGITRITVANSWNLSLRCQNQDYDLFHTEISVSPNKNHADNISITCADYTGAPMHLNVGYTYVASTRLLELTLVLINGGRTDYVQAKIINNDTGYLDMIKIINNGGCHAQIRLTNQLND